jgi:hypothetical protein
MIKVGKATLLFPIFFALLCSTHFTWAQKIEIGGSLGATSYKGDIMPDFGISTSMPAGSLFLRQNMSPAVVLKYSVMAGGIRGNAANASDIYLSTHADTLGLSFSRFLAEASAQIEYNFFDYRAERLRKWTPYLFTGIGLLYFNTQKTPDTVEPASAFQPVIPMGLGAKWVIGRKWNFGVEMGARKTFTDYLDGASDKHELIGWQRGNPQTKDWYLFTGFTLSYTIYTIPCPFDTY